MGYTDPRKIKIFSECSMVYRYMINFQRKYHKTPTIREIMFGLGFGNTSTVMSRIYILVKAGRVERIQQYSCSRRYRALEMKIEDTAE